MFKNRVIVMARFNDGDSIKVSVKAVDRGFTDSDFKYLKDKIDCSFKRHDYDILYFTVRRTLNDIKDNWKCKSFEELDKVLVEVFS